MSHGTRRDGAAAVLGVKGHLVVAPAARPEIVAGAGAGCDLGVEAVEVGNAIGAQAGRGDRHVVGSGAAKVAVGQDAGAAEASFVVLGQGVSSETEASSRRPHPHRHHVDHPITRLRLESHGV